jgi:hypothetical protein
MASSETGGEEMTTTIEQKQKVYGKGKCVNVKSSLYNQIFTINEYIPWRDGSRSVWVTAEDGTEMSFKEAEIELLEVFRQ